MALNKIINLIYTIKYYIVYVLFLNNVCMFCVITFAKLKEDRFKNILSYNLDVKCKLEKTSYETKYFF